ncbi:tRNA (5-methylaminomethyl-2-thiouridylate)-methyltransferase [Kwoniella sp. DSM 27419]
MLRHSISFITCEAGPSRLASVPRQLPAARRPLRLGGRRGISTGSEVASSPAIPGLDDLGLRSGDSVTVAMSGGVDSATTLRILTELPVHLDVVFMRNWDPLLSESRPAVPPGFTLAYPSAAKGSIDSPCSWEKDWNDVRSVSRSIGIPNDRVRLVDLSKEYWTRVFEPAVGVWERGGTPNPDVDCNREIKFGALLDHLPVKPRHFLATGHYGRVDHTSYPEPRLYRAKDRTKDQTYYLSQVDQAQLSRTILPLGRLTKTEVRQLAARWNLPNHAKEESMGVCFIGERGKFGDFIAQYTQPPDAPGRLVLPTGQVVGSHQGLWYYTIGQRAKIANQLKPLYVAAKGVGETGQDILVVPGSVRTDGFHWVHGDYPARLLDDQSDVNVQVRHRMDPVSARVSRDDSVPGGVEITFAQPLSGVSPGQVAAVWKGDWCLGSGVIRDTGAGSQS